MFLKTSSGDIYNIAQFTRIFVESHPSFEKYYVVGERGYKQQYTLGIYDSKKVAEEELNKIFEGENVRVLHDIDSKSTNRSNELSFEIA